MKKEVVDSPPRALVTLASKFDQAEKEADRLEELLKKAKETRRSAEKKLVEEMVTQDVESMRVTGLGLIRRQVCVYANVTDREALNTWIKRRKSLAGMFTITVNGSKLKAFVRELLENGKPAPPGCEPYLQTEIRRS